MRILKSMARKIVITAALACFGIAAPLVAQTGSAAPAQLPRAPAANAADRQRRQPRTQPSTVRSWINTAWRVTTQRTASPAEDPVNLEAAGFDDLLGHAETWERVLRKLSVRAMPPPGMPRPTEAEYAGFTGWLAASLDRAWEGQSTPGRYVVHRLNRAEYANAVRDLLAVDIDVSDLLPTDGAEFGFDNIATALKTSPLLLEGYVNAAQRVSAMAVGDPQVRPGTTEHSISREFSQNGYIDGLPLGTVGGTVVHHVFPADAEYKLSGRLVRGVQEGYAGVEGNDTPYTFVITVDGTEVYSAPIGGPKDDEIQAADLAAAQPIIDKRMTGRVRVTAGPHDVGFTWKERPFQLQDVWEPSKRDSQEVHMVGGHAEAEDRFDRRPVQRARRERRAQPATALCVPSCVGVRNRLRRSAPGANLDETACATKILTNLARRAYRRPVTAGGRRGADVVLQAGRGKAAAVSTMGFAPAWRAFFRARTFCIASRKIRLAPAPASRIRSATSSWPRACPSSCGAASPMKSCWTWRQRGGCGSRECSPRRCTACSPTSAPTPWSKISPGSGCSSAIWRRRSFRTC